METLALCVEQRVCGRGGTSARDGGSKCVVGNAGSFILPNLTAIFLGVQRATNLREHITTVLEVGVTHCFYLYKKRV